MSLRVTTEHKLTSAGWRASSHCEPRAGDAQPELVVIHCISLPEGDYGTGAPTRLFLGELQTSEHISFADLAEVRVAPHLFIDRLGDVTQFVSFDQQAWHAGQSCWRGRERCNAFSIGIELEGCVTDGYTQAQYQTLQKVLVALLGAYDSLSVDNIVGHQDIAPWRKSDPGPFFDWAWLLATLHASRREVTILHNQKSFNATDT